ncbi:MAG: matrixin family metalloprotease [Bacillota bacterium]|nr:matrixin family metalloprotease [Bacillota bacterium]
MKRFRWTLLMLVLALAVTSNVLAAPKEGHELQKITFVHYRDPHGKPAPRSTGEDATDYKLISGGVKLAGPVTYKIVDRLGIPKGAAAAILAATQEWNDVTGTDPFGAEDKADLLTTKNVLTWGSLQPNVIAVTYMYYWTKTKTMDYFEITFNNNDDYAWSGQEACPSGEMDLRNIATHELGHALGLSDLYAIRDSELTMYGYSDVGETKKRGLGAGDILGAQKLYGTQP